MRIDGLAVMADEDMLDWLDPRLGGSGFNVVTIGKALGIHWEPVCFKPKMIANLVTEYDGLRADQVALMLIMLERVGLQTDPSGMVELLIPDIKARQKKFLSAAELDVFWFKKSRHKYTPFIILDSGATSWEKTIGRIKTTTGYQILLKGDLQGTPTHLEVRSPKYWERKEPFEVICKDCGMSWYKGDPESSLKDREEHKLIMSYLDPKPLIEVLGKRNNIKYSEIVVADSPKWKQREMYVRARAFKRELRFDFIQLLSPDSKQKRDRNIEGILFTNDPGATIGACGFKYYAKEKYWGLQWIWICPKERRKGHLKACWPKLREHYGAFHVEPPVSQDMQHF